MRFQITNFEKSNGVERPTATTQKNQIDVSIFIHSILKEQTRRVVAMWSGGANNDNDDVNDNGERVRLYQPILYGRKPTMSNLSSSFIGGQSSSSLTTVSSSSSTPRCPSCQEPLKQLVQLFVPKSNNNYNKSSSDRTLIVWACNRASCVAGLFTNNNKDGFSKGGGNGVIVCKRYMVEKDVKSIEQESKKVTTASNDNAMSSPDSACLEEENDWTVDDNMQDDNNDLDDLEAKLASMESNTITNKHSSSTTGKKKCNPKSEKSSSGEGGRDTVVTGGSTFPCFELHSVQEPLAPRRSTIMDEDDVGISASGASNDKIQQMLARYMQEEDDEDILTMLRNAGGSSGSGSNSGAANIVENDPGVSPQDRALLRYSDRLQRSPRQVLRYAYNGQPLWSIPLPSSNKNVKASRKQQGKYTRNDCDNNDNDNVLQVPVCSNCGAPRVFEVQILPSILHVLDVDRYAPTAAAAAAIATAADQDKVAAHKQHANNNKAYNNNIYSAEYGGMDFGNIAIYTCSASCCRNGQEEYVVVQDSVDKFSAGQGHQQQQQQQAQDNKRRHNMYNNNEVVVIPEDSKFDDNDEA